MQIIQISKIFQVHIISAASPCISLPRTTTANNQNILIYANVFSLLCFSFSRQSCTNLPQQQEHFSLLIELLVQCSAIK